MDPGKRSPPRGQFQSYNNIDYDTKSRFSSYWHQTRELYRLNAAQILEIGTGSGFVTTYLRNWGVDVVTLDVLVDLRPDILASVTDLPFRDNAFEAIGCFEVLEHIPFSEFPKGLDEIRRVTSEWAVISLPDSKLSYRLSGQLPKVGRFHWWLPSPPFIVRKRPSEPNHFWEINLRGYPLRRIRQQIEAAGFTVLSTYRVFEFAMHRFFILKKR